MADTTVPVFDIGAINLRVSPYLQSQGVVTRALNVDRDMIGAWTKRSGYTTFLGTPDNSQINSIFSWNKNDGTSSFVYRTSGTSLYYSVQGTGAWTLAGNGTITSGGHFGYAVLDDNLIGGDGVTNSRYTTDGMNFTDAIGAPFAEQWAEYQQRIWAARGTATSGSNTDLFYSTVGTASDWTTDSSSIRIPGPGRINAVFKAADRIVATKDSGLMFKYDGNSLVDLATDSGPTSAYSMGQREGYWIYINRLGAYGYGGVRPEIVSNPIQRQFYNSLGSGIAGTTFNNAPGISHRYNWLCSVGTITDDLTYETIPDAIIKYDFQLNEWSNWQFANRPSAWGTYQDIDDNVQLIFGDANGQCYQYSGTAVSDNGKPINSVLQGFIWGKTLDDKRWHWIMGVFNPGCKARVQFAISDSFTPRTLDWKDAGDAFDGVLDYHFPSGTRGKYLHWKISDSSTSAPFKFYGFEFQYERIPR